MKTALAVGVGFALFAEAAAAQTLRLEFSAALATDRNVGVQAALPSARGPGLAVSLSGGMARIEGEVTGVAVRLRLPSMAPAGNEWQTLAQGGLRLRYRVVGPLAAEAGVFGRKLDPDPNGAAVGFVTTGVFLRWSVTRGAWVWGRLGLIPWATFEGGGGLGFAGETGVGFELEVSRRLRASASYGFQRLDRKLTAPDGSSFRAPLEHDVLQVGVGWFPGSVPRGDR
jgi:hypothetical protein